MKPFLGRRFLAVVKTGMSAGMDHNWLDDVLLATSSRKSQVSLRDLTIHKKSPLALQPGILRLPGEAQWLGAENDSNKHDDVPKQGFANGT